MLGRGTSFLTVPVGGGLVYCYADITTDSATDKPDGDPVGWLRERFAGFAAPVPQLLDQLEDPAQIHVAPIEQVAAEGWGRGAVVLGGVADHGISPNMAQGAALAFEDALCWRHVPARRRNGQRRGGRVRGTSKPPHRLGARLDPPSRPHPQPAPGSAQLHPASARAADLPVQLPPAAGAHLAQQRSPPARQPGPRGALSQAVRLRPGGSSYPGTDRRHWRQAAQAGQAMRSTPRYRRDDRSPFMFRYGASQVPLE
jgi:hypothetical protein